MTCVHYGDKHTRADIKGKMVYTFKGYSVIDFFCPTEKCGKIMNGCEEITMAIPAKQVIRIKREKRTWTEADREYIRKWHGKKSAREIGTALKRTEKAVQNQIRKMKIALDIQAKT